MGRDFCEWHRAGVYGNICVNYHTVLSVSVSVCVYTCFIYLPTAGAHLLL